MKGKIALVLIAGIALALSAAAAVFDPAADYQVAYEDYGLVTVKSGKELMGGLDVKIPEPTGSLLVKYRRVR